MKYIFGVDLGGTSAKIGLFSQDENLIEKWEIKTDRSDNGKNILPNIAASLEEKAKELSINKDDILGIGIGIPGPVIGERIVNKCANLGWGKIDAATELESLTGLTVKVGNDANVALLGEAWKGCGKGYSSMIMITIGTGIGSALITHGKIVSGATGSGGEMGHVTVNLNETITCGCGKKGCLEQYASATGMVRHGKELLAKYGENSVLYALEEITAKAIVDGAKAGDKLCLETVDFMGDTLGMALANANALNDVELIIIGGGVSKAGDIVIDAIKKGYLKCAFHAQKDVEFKLASLGNDAGMYGAAKLIL